MYLVLRAFIRLYVSQFGRQGNYSVDLRSGANLLQVPYPGQGLYRFHNLYGDVVVDNPIIQPSPQPLSLKLASATILDDVYTR